MCLCESETGGFSLNPGGSAMPQMLRLLSELIITSMDQEPDAPVLCTLKFNLVIA